ncbi:Uma2 family endonuclease [Nonomuraea typhae]|uniref:Uma2 family endonuclease n=1 Tax=Nonomuraea typhae TaxID=2603600 RepID=UPI0012FB7353|nr:Uma2 family endonuclease [Nonomuraea typhae]
MVITEHRPRVKPYTAPADQLPTTVRELFDALPPLPGLRVEVIEGTLRVSPMGKPKHQAIAWRLSRLFIPVIDREDWECYGGVNICIDGPRDTLVPDFALAPKDCPLWGDSELRSTGVILAAEVVSPGSAHDDRVIKPDLYAAGGVPIYLLIDPLEGSVSVHYEIVDELYNKKALQPLGCTLPLPAPIDFDLDTSTLLMD